MSDQAEGLRIMAGTRSLKPTEIITIASGKGGVGKSSLALNMAISLSRKGKKPLIIDTDFGFSNIDVMLGVKTRYDLMDVIKHKKDLSEVIEHGLEGVKFVSGGSGVYELTRLNSKQLMSVVDKLVTLEDMVDTIIFDTGAGVSDNMLRLIYASNQTVVVTTPEPTAVVDAYALIKIISEKIAKPNISLVLNKVTSASEADSVMDGLVSVAKKNIDVNISKLGYIMHDDKMQKAIKMQVPILVSFPKCLASANIDALSSKFLNIPAKEPGKLGILSFLEKLAGGKR
ncbi:MAG: P-loop NTPase [Burkholderiales bacterium]